MKTFAQSNAVMSSVEVYFEVFIETAATEYQDR